ncbi:f-box domain-containing protein [Moniliophthora roreri MCA 2997]|uniref:F-box domain-containing protein n=2 Tax=Moniliophthora roreri TaxID=221103 RepID=V2X394_MONRO|nr:f-box domain-containing protein [Moniliophthora roreri MCA 2997]
MRIHDLPPEIIDDILFNSDPLDVASVSQSSRYFYAHIYHAPDRHLWRGLYLAQPLDDPEKCVSPLGSPRVGEFDWKGELQAIIRARTVLENPKVCKQEERCTILRTLIKMVLWVPPLQSASDILKEDKISQNLLWVAAECRKGALLDPETFDWEPTEEEEDLRAQLHTLLGVTPRDWKEEARLESRAFVYLMRNYNWRNEFGPFLESDSGANRVDWVHVRHLHRDISMKLLQGMEGAEQLDVCIYHLSSPYTQLIIPEGLNLDEEEDWAGVGGTWDVSFCFCDHHLLIRYNHSDIHNGGIPDTSILAGASFQEVFRTMAIQLHVTKVVHDDKHPTRPVIFFGGQIAGPINTIMSGSVRLTDDDQIRWHFVSGELGNPIWSGEGIQVGGVRSAYGVLGAWTTIFHDRDDPVGPFWLRKHLES